MFEKVNPEHPDKIADRIAGAMELDPRYVDVIIDRWQTFTGEKAVLISE